MTTEADASTDATESTETGTDSTDWKAEAEKFKTLARKQEERAKANAAAAKELETFRQQSMTDTEKAVEAARNEGRSEGARQASERIVRADIRAAAAGRNVDVDALLDGVNFGRFLDDDGESDIKAINAWMDRIAPLGEEKPKPRLDLGQGARGGQQNAALNGDPLLRDLKQTLGIG